MTEIIYLSGDRYKERDSKMTAEEKKEHIRRLASKAEYAKCIKISLLLLYERLNYPAAGLQTFYDCFVDYMRGVKYNKAAVREMDEETKKYIGYCLDEVKVKGTITSMCVKTARPLAIKQGATILYTVMEWERADIREYVREMWDMLEEYPTSGRMNLRINKMLKDTKVRVNAKDFEHLRPISED